MDKKPETTPPVIKGNSVISWQAPEFVFHRKTADWFWAVGIITISLTVGTILIKNFLLTFLVGVSGFSILMYGAKKPSIVNFSISNKGVVVGGKLYLFENLEYFWVDYNPPYTKQLILQSNKTLMPHIIIPLGEADPETIRETLLLFIKEQKIEESFSETISKLLRF